MALFIGEKSERYSFYIPLFSWTSLLMPNFPANVSAVMAEEGMVNLCGQINLLFNVNVH